VHKRAKLTDYIRRSFELRLKRTAKLSPNMASDEPMWVLLSIFPELTEENEVVEIVGCFMDIRYVVDSPGRSIR
jgi:hypothetical protein